MCLASAYSSSETEQPLFKEISRITITGNKVELENLFGENKTIEGKISEVDFMSSRIIIEQA